MHFESLAKHDNNLQHYHLHAYRTQGQIVHRLPCNTKSSGAVFHYSAIGYVTLRWLAGPCIVHLAEFHFCLFPECVAQGELLRYRRGHNVGEIKKKETCGEMKYSESYHGACQTTLVDAEI